MPRKRFRRNITPLAIEQILAWADAYRRKYGKWPCITAGAIDGTTESWSGVNFALYYGRRGMKGKSSLAELLRAHRGVIVRREPLDEEMIFQRAQAHFQRTGKWPTTRDPVSHDAFGETWDAVNNALIYGRRGLPGGSSLELLLAKHGISREDFRKITPEQILKWADQFFAEYGQWPHFDSGPIRESPENTWYAIEMALRLGTRGLKGKSTLSRFLNEHRGIFQGLRKRPNRIPPERRLDLDKIMAWAKAHRRRTGEWPKVLSGPIRNSNGVTWRIVDHALRYGSRGLPGGSSLAKLFGDRRKVRSR